MSRRVTPLLAALLTLLALAGCDVIKQLTGSKPKAGDKCDQAGKETCLDDKSGLACHNGAWEAMSCQSCVQGVDNGTCDQSYAKDGEVCNAEKDTVCDVD
jgi:hypothetical protein